MLIKKKNRSYQYCIKLQLVTTKSYLSLQFSGSKVQQPTQEPSLEYWQRFFTPSENNHIGNSTKLMTILIYPKILRISFQDEQQLLPRVFKYRLIQELYKNNTFKCLHEEHIMQSNQRINIK